ncbi:MAG: hypothetical protein ACOYUZ_03355 [Patescibacteria group bacterium]
MTIHIEHGILPKIDKSSQKEKLSFSFTGMLSEIKQGKSDSENNKLFELNIQYIGQEQLQTLARHMTEQERCGKTFVERFFFDPKFRKRVKNICKNFAEHDETISCLEEVEIFSEIMEPGYEDIGTMLETSNPARRFKNLKAFSKQDIIAGRLNDMYRAVTELSDPVIQSQIKTSLERSFAMVGLSDIDDSTQWQKLVNDKEKLQIFLQDAGVGKIYEQINQGKRIENISRRIQCLWLRDYDGNISPVIDVNQQAHNPENEQYAQLGFQIAKQTRTDAVTMKTETARVIREGVIIVDETVRNNNGGMDFVTGNIPLINKYKLQQMEFLADFQIGSYTWTKIADIDYQTMIEAMPDDEIKELGEKPWTEKKMKALVMKKVILPNFEQNLVRAVKFAIDNASDTAEKKYLSRLLIDDLINTQYTEIKAKAENGEASIKDLAGLGRGFEVFRFNKRGELAPPQDPDSEVPGHLGKAAIMGIPWPGRISLDTASIFEIIDKLHQGNDLAAQLKRNNKKIALLLRKII